jgi:anti-sigma regulatory factor (Ser/Thr protein kinase)
VDPTSAASRRAVKDTAHTTRLSREEVDNLVTATSEAVTNAVIHGHRPVTVRVWAAPERMVVTVTDPGAGPQDPYVGLVPRRPAVEGGGGFGLWICHQLVATTYARGEEGFTIRLLAGRAARSETQPA